MAKNVIDRELIIRRKDADALFQNYDFLEIVETVMFKSLLLGRHGGSVR